jgi:hypothetical protein
MKFFYKPTVMSVRNFENLSGKFNTGEIDLFHVLCNDIASTKDIR